MKQPDENPEYLTSKEAAKMLRYTSVRAFHQAAKRHRIPRIRCNKRRFLFSREALEKWLRER
jgi:excisionase family DNA binding protein